MSRLLVATGCALLLSPIGCSGDAFDSAKADGGMATEDGSLAIEDGSLPTTQTDATRIEASPAADVVLSTDGRPRDDSEVVAAMTKPIERAQIVGNGGA